MFRRYGLTIEKRTSPFLVYLVARDGAFFVAICFGESIVFFLLFIESISIY